MNNNLLNQKDRVVLLRILTKQGLLKASAEKLLKLEKNEFTKLVFDSGHDINSLSKVLFDPATQ